MPGVTKRMTVEERFIGDITKEVWPVLNISVKRQITGRLGQSLYGDYVIAVDGKTRYVDIKAEEKKSPNFPIEVIQDWPSMDRGWFNALSACDEIWYGQYGDDLLVWRIGMHRLRALAPRIGTAWRSAVCASGQGVTVLILAPLDELVNEKVAFQVWPI